jgi:nonsense-mediated mRNA decay protein 3
VKLTIQGEVMSGTILQQSFVVEYIVNHQMCDDCRRVEAKDTWNASVSFTIKYLPTLVTFSKSLRQIILRSNVLRHYFYLPKVIQQVQTGLL